MITKREVDLIAFKCVCKNCEYEFQDADFSELEYGTRILRTMSGRYCAVWEAHQDKYFDEFQELMRRNIGTSLSPRDEAAFFNKIFGVCCDPVEGEPVDASQGCICPNCGSDLVDVFDLLPTQRVTITLPLIQHTLWAHKSAKEREEAIRSAIRENL